MCTAKLEEPRAPVLVFLLTRPGSDGPLPALLPGMVVRHSLKLFPGHRGNLASGCLVFVILPLPPMFSGCSHSVFAVDLCLFLGELTLPGLSHWSKTPFLPKENNFVFLNFIFSTAHCRKRITKFS